MRYGPRTAFRHSIDDLQEQKLLRLVFKVPVIDKTNIRDRLIKSIVTKMR
jgi:hypothetical protein